MNVTKENAIEYVSQKITCSWTWDRLTPSEARRWVEFFETMQSDIKGTAKQRIEYAWNLYTAFLSGCGYTGLYWREPADSDAPTF